MAMHAALITTQETASGPVWPTKPHRADESTCCLHPDHVRRPHLTWREGLVIVAVEVLAIGCTVTCILLVLLN